MDLEALSLEMLIECERVGQSTRRVPSTDDVPVVRRTLVRLARGRNLKIRTARIGDAVAVVRLDAAIWNDDGPTMRAKLRPPD